jgi:hypothetical protein
LKLTLLVLDGLGVQQFLAFLVLRERHPLVVRQSFLWVLKMSRLVGCLNVMFFASISLIDQKHRDPFFMNFKLLLFMF